MKKQSTENSHSKKSQAKGIANRDKAETAAGDGESHHLNEYGGPRLQDPEEKGESESAVRNKSGAV